MHGSFPAALAASLILLSAEAIAQNDGADKDSGRASSADVTVNAVFGRYGFSDSPNINSQSCKVSMQLEQKEFLTHIDELKTIGLLNPDLTQTAINLKPNLISMAFIMQMLPVATKEIYENNKNVDLCEFTQSLIGADDYGNDTHIMVLSYNFTRSLYKKINWDKFEAQKMLKVAPKFQFNPAFEVLIIKEQRSQ
jgi:hypothetical protein